MKLCPVREIENRKKIRKTEVKNEEKEQQENFTSSNGSD